MKEYLAGKRVGRSLYVQVAAILDGRSVARQDEIASFKKALVISPMKPDGRGLVEIAGKKVRIIQLSDEYDPHPSVQASVIVHTDTGAWKKGKSRGQIYHRMDAVVDHEDWLWPLFKFIILYEEALGALGPFTLGGRTLNGHLEVWKKQLACRHIDYDKLMSDISFMFNNLSSVTLRKQLCA